MTICYGWLEKLVTRLHKSNITLLECHASKGRQRAYSVSSEDWSRLAVYLHEQQLRFAGLWVDYDDEQFRVFACVEKHGDHLLLHTQLPASQRDIKSWSLIYPAANGFERHAADLFGLSFLDSPDQRRWVRHAAWPASVFPLQTQNVDQHFVADAPPDADFPFHRIDGDAVYEIPVGPVHAGIIEPGHFRFHAMGETVLSLELRLGYVHKGIEKLAQGADTEKLLRLAGRVSGDSTVAHAWAAAKAIESASETDVPERALLLRALLCERERVANHLGDIGAVCNDVGFSFAHSQFSRLREQWLRLNAQWCGHRLLMDQIMVGGVACNIDANISTAMQHDGQHLRTELATLTKLLRDN